MSCARPVGHSGLAQGEVTQPVAPAAKWNTVRLLLVLTAQLGLATKQVDYTAAFVHAVTC